MSREIKFRAWLINDNCWLDDGFSISMDGLFWYDDNGSESPIKGNLILMQYSGLKDKNGVEIYEGDILKYHFEDGTVDYMPVFFKDGSFWTGKKDEELLFDDLDPKHGFRIEVAGNIHQNSDLLEL